MQSGDSMRLGLTQKFSRLSIARKLFITFASFMLMILLVVMVNIINTNVQDSYREEAIDTQGDAAKAAELKNLILDARNTQTLYVLTYVSVGPEIASEPFEAGISQLDEALEIIDENFAGGSEDEHHDDIISDLRSEVVDFRDDFLNLANNIVPTRYGSTSDAYRESLDAFSEDAEEVGDLAINLSIDSVRGISESYITFPSPNNVPHVNGAISDLRLVVRSADISEEDRELLLDSVDNMRNEYAALITEDVAMIQFVMVLFDNSTVIGGLIDEFVAEEQHEQEEALEALETAKQRGLYAQIALSAVALVLSFGLAYLIQRDIVGSVRSLQKATQLISSGQYNERVSITSQDEIGQLATDFNEMAKAIETHEQNLRQNSERLAKINVELDQARNEALEANRLKSQFLATMSHELRTPLNAAIGYSQIMMAGMAGELTEKQHSFTERIFNNSETLLKLIDDILDLSKIEAGRMEIIQKPFEIDKWISNIKIKIDPLAEAKDLPIEYDVDSQLPKEIIGDPDRLQQIAVNLLTNAVKFTEDGRVSFKLSHHPEEKSWSLAVTDTGIGIASHALEFIFDPFRQADGSTQRKYSGTGLGLSIVQQLASSMGGSVHVKSEVDKGSTFTVKLPLVTQLPKTAEQEPEKVLEN